MKRTMINYMKNDIFDELYTPSFVLDSLVKYLPENIVIWECTDFGGSNITKVLKNKGFKVISTHLKDFDFLNDEPTFEFDFIITNPPYSLKDEFLTRCYSYNKPFALLMPLTTLEGVYRSKLFNRYGLQLIVLDRRVNFLSNKNRNWFNTSWFCWRFLPRDLIFESIPSAFCYGKLDK